MTSERKIRPPAYRAVLSRAGGALAGIAALCALATSPVAQASGPTLVTAPAGTFQGALNSTRTMRQFLGIRYAAPPVGALRWRPPQAPQSPSGTVDATRFGGHCAQPLSQFGNGTLNEDCLFLNVFAPNDNKQDHAVMFWIHGGALFLGESDEYNASQLVAEGVVVVTINYRLGALGFMAHPAFTAESPDKISGNYGILDQQFAMQWVKRNIAAFGGDPNKVTIFGESAGGSSTLVNMVSPLASGLFHRAIVESGGYQMRQPTQADSEKKGTEFAIAEGCADPNQADAQTAACLRAVPVDKILGPCASQNSCQSLTFEGTVASPVIDGKVLPESLVDAIAAGHFARVPLINGSNHDEFRLFIPLVFGFQDNVVPDAQAATTPGTTPYSAALQILLATIVSPDRLPGVITLYPSGNTPLSANIALAAAATDAIFACNAHTIDKSASQFVPVFAYEFNDEQAPDNFLSPTTLHDGTNYPYGSDHTSEIQYLFPVSNPSGLGLDLKQTPLTANQQQLAHQMVIYWTTFAATGDPNRGEAPVVWPQYVSDLDDLISFVPPTPTHETASDPTDLATVHQCAFWDQSLNLSEPSIVNLGVPNLP
jgi:para-nitrobenzyl esterase